MVGNASEYSGMGSWNSLSLLKRIQSTRHAPWYRVELGNLIFTMSRLIQWTVLPSGL